MKKIFSFISGILYLFLMQNIAFADIVGPDDIINRAVANNSSMFIILGALIIVIIIVSIVTLRKIRK